MQKIFIVYDIVIYNNLYCIYSPGELLAPDSDKLLLGYCQQVVFGMHYLGTKGFVHRDVAARNILMTHDNILKVAKFIMNHIIME